MKQTDSSNAKFNLYDPYDLLMLIISQSAGTVNHYTPVDTPIDRATREGSEYQEACRE